MSLFNDDDVAHQFETTITRDDGSVVMGTTVTVEPGNTAYVNPEDETGQFTVEVHVDEMTESYTLFWSDNTCGTQEEYRFVVTADGNLKWGGGRVTRLL